MTDPIHRPCRYLPIVEPGMTHKALTSLPKNSPHFYFKALQYGHYLWQHGHAGRGMLALTRALYADLPPHAPILKHWPLPYAALRWIAAYHSSDNFPGNPRVSFQHQATRLRGKREALRRARAWAVLALIREVRPSLPVDLKNPVVEPPSEQIHELLMIHGNPGEAALWERVLKS